MSLRTKRAAVSKQFGYFKDWRFPENPRTADYFAETIRVDTTLDSQSNPRSKDGKYRSGGPFWSRKYEVQTIPLGSWVTYRYGLYPAYVGAYMVGKPSGWLQPPSWFMGDTHKNNLLSDLAEQGSKGWARARPTNPDFSAATSLYELKDVPGMLKDAIRGLIKDMKRHPRYKNRSSLSKAGEWHLALQFGWLPLLKDVQSFVKAQKSKQKTLQQLIRDEGKPVRRSRNITSPRAGMPVGESWTWTQDTPYNGAMGPVHVTQCYGDGKATTECRSSFFRKTWAMGRFRYHLPPGPKDVKWKAKMLRRILGLRVTPSAVYQAMPWSWLADYFTGLGDFIDAVSGGVEDRLAADYFYVMETQRYTSTTTASQSIRTGKYSSGTASALRIDTWQLKTRVVGSPFGFGIKGTNLSPMQWSILGALGASRLP